eukprot:CAMPEP_0206483806 /NCGR_PEP_ID=MMETSP0324_2-20121206/39636_1 /ASSEMBLY_ACC=CAM_ASM_000836 /TAXON_ID=2866 /ORGANISM="Crypthecodinium cohnii, Strain Seligo" /LENGTH=479 /DNA_ID=CAMNT_0053961909 /DNA_START=69 /DNA_END=1508 /DNA_ORIENTATION=+
MAPMVEGKKKSGIAEPLLQQGTSPVQEAAFMANKDEREKAMATVTETENAKEKKIRGVMPGEKPIREPPSFTKGNYKINWLSTNIICIPPLIVLAAFLAGIKPDPRTVVVFFIFYLLNGLGITAGYHRMFSHKAYRGHWFTEWMMLFWGGGAWQGSAKWWARNHRIHHRYIDTDLDPYNANRGFVYTHVGWMFMKQDYEILGHADMRDLNANKAVRFQHNNYLIIAMINGIILPTVICGLGWNDWAGGFVYAALAKMIFVHHSTFFINSLAHTDLFGAKQNFSDNHSSHDSFVCALVTLGEGYHNFHHEFAQDYRNGIMWYHFDPTKWLIRSLEAVGLAYGLVRIPNDVIERNAVELKHKKVQQDADALRAKLDEMEKLVDPKEEYSWAQFEQLVAGGQKLTVVGNFVIDLRKPIPTGAGYTHKSRDVHWYNEHPGGRAFLDMFVGKDATEAMSGGIYKHSQGANNLLRHLRCATLKSE